MLRTLLAFLLLSGAAHAQLTSTNLPIIVITTPGSTAITGTQAPGTMKIVNNGSGTNAPGDAGAFTGPIGIRTSGPASYPKKSYYVETWGATAFQTRDTALLGMPSENDWVLLALYPDRSLMRPMIAFEVYRQMGFYAPRMRPVEVTVNGTYAGVYLWGERIKRDDNRVDMANLALTDNSGERITGGYLFKIDEDADDYWTSTYTPPYRSASQDIKFHYDDPEDNAISGVQKNYIKRYVDSFENALQSAPLTDTVAGWRGFAAQRWWDSWLILQEAMGNEEAYRKSTFLYKDRSRKLRVGPPWGFETSLYNTADCNAHRDTAWMFRHAQYCPANTYLPPFWWYRLQDDPVYMQDLKCRYSQWRASGGPLDTARLFSHIDSLATLLTSGGAVSRNFILYPIWSTPLVNEPTPMTANHAQEVARIKTYLRARLTFLDSKWTVSLPCAISTSVSEQQMGEPNVALYPNPVANVARLEMFTSVAETVLVTVRDVYGRAVFSRSWMKAAGTQALTIDAARWPAGMYTVSAQVRGQQPATLRLIKAEE